LVAHFEAYRGDLSEDSLVRLEKNPLRILDSKDPRDRPAADGAPSIDDFLTPAASDFFSQVTAGLDASGVKWTRNTRLVRGLDYYRHTAFEFVTDRLGAQGTVLAGGRYDGLIESMGGPHTPAVGWAAGIERLAMLIENSESEPLDVAVVVEDDELTSVGHWFVSKLRRDRVSAELFAEGASKKRFDKARRLSPVAVLILDARLLAEGQVANLRLKEIRQGFSLGPKRDVVGAITTERFRNVDRHAVALGKETALFERELA
jgi:histidyl-tRNA synthetase